MRLHIQTILEFIKGNNNFDNIQKQYIKKEFSKINDEFITKSIWEAIKEDSIFKMYRVYSTKWKYINTIFKQRSSWILYDSNLSKIDLQWVSIENEWIIIL